MRYLYFSIIALLFTLVSCSTNRTVSHAFHKYGSEEGVVSVSVPGWVIGLAARIGDLEKEERLLLKSIDKVKVLTIEDPGLNANVNFYDEYYHRIRAKNGYEDLVLVREKEENVGILGRFDGDIVKELIILVGGDENTIVYLKGDINPNTIGELIDKQGGVMNVRQEL